ncbi:MAG: DNA alkylation repair protein [Chitinophagaceae bacterium]|nr:DNA alkylation repair protein [Chitinophagaceae bacterium]
MDMTFNEVMTELEKLGTEQTRKTWKNHGATGEFWGVKIGDMKGIQKKIKHNHELALALYNTGNTDVMYFAGLISEPAKMSKAELQQWAEQAPWHMISEYTVAWTAAESRFGQELAMEWIGSDRELIASAGWSTYSNLLALKSDEELDKKEIKSLLQKVSKTIHQQPNRVRSSMNGFVIAVGAYFLPLAAEAKKTALAVGKVSVDMGGTACKVPDALAYIEKVALAGKAGKKKKTVFC